jgi:hypothetical protein
MERRATDPEALDDLFRLDHLTTRMRRHAEGLVILAGAPPGRAWSSPVRMVDVMRGAIAEVEDYARVSVATRSQAALAGSAVADVIHLLAELIENATTLSPPYTSVRVSGDTVANGFAIEVEDRGLGMSPQRIAELNERLASPPEFNPSDSEQLGLFVVSQLAKRHGIRVTLKASPYGGTAAIVLIPQHLVVTEEAFRAGLPGEPAAIGMAALGTNGKRAAAELAVPTGLLSGPGLGGQELGGQELGGQELGGQELGGPVNGAAGHPDFDAFTPRRRDTGDEPVPAEAGSAAPGSGPGRPAGATGAPQAGAENTSYVTSPPYQGSAPYPGPGAGPYADQPDPFPGWPGRTVAGGSVRPPTPATPMTPVASPRPGKSSGPPWELSRQSGPLPAIAADGDSGTQPGAPGADGDVQGLPRRVRQASLAPQLRDNPPHRRTAAAPSASTASGPTPAEIRQTMSALQRGWQEGRSQQVTGPAAGDAPFGGPSPGAVPSKGARPSPGPSPDGDRRPATDEPRGESDGT